MNIFRSSLYSQRFFPEPDLTSGHHFVPFFRWTKLALKSLQTITHDRKEMQVFNRHEQRMN